MFTWICFAFALGVVIGAFIMFLMANRHMSRQYAAIEKAHNTRLAMLYRAHEEKLREQFDAGYGCGANAMRGAN